MFGLLFLWCCHIFFILTLLALVSHLVIIIEAFTDFIISFLLIRCFSELLFYIGLNSINFLVFLFLCRLIPPLLFIILVFTFFILFI